MRRAWVGYSTIVIHGWLALVVLPASAQTSPDLIGAVKTGQIEAVRTLLDAGADTDLRQGDGATALHWAAHRNDLHAADLLIAAGAEVNAANELGATPLWLAAMNAAAPMVTRLLAAGADPNAALQLGETPLMTAARAGGLDVVELLLAHGADVYAQEKERGQTALMWAAAQRHAEVTRLLLVRGADVHARSKVWHQLENTAGNTNPSGNFQMAHGGSTPLLFVARNGDVATARALVEGGADVNDTAASGASALVIAAHSGQTALATFLLEQHADPNAAGAGYTALHAAVLRGQVELVDALLEHGADLDALIEHGTPGRRFSADYSLRHQMIGASAYWLAAQFGEPEILRTLADRGADPLIIPVSGIPALQAAMGMPSIYLETRRNRSSIAFPDPSEEERLTLGLARFLLDQGAAIDATDPQGNTALHDAVRKGFGAVVELLAARGASLEAETERGVTPLALAESAQTLPSTNGTRGTRPEVAALLRRLGARK